MKHHLAFLTKTEFGGCNLDYYYRAQSDEYVSSFEKLYSEMKKINNTAMIRRIKKAVSPRLLNSSPRQRWWLWDIQKN